MVLSGPVARRPAGRDRRAAGPSVVRGQPVPPGVQDPPRAAAPAVRRVRGGVASRSATGASRSSPRRVAPDGRRPTADRQPAGRGVRCRRVQSRAPDLAISAVARGSSRRRIRRVDPRRRRPRWRRLVRRPARLGRTACSSRPTPSASGSAVAFVLGASARTIPTGALRGVIGLLSAVAAYYVLIAVLRRRVSGRSARRTPRPSGARSRCSRVR